MTQTTNNIVLAKVNAKVLLDNTIKLQDNISCPPVNMLSVEAISILLDQTIICHIPSRKLGKSRVLSSKEEIVAILKQARHVNPSTYTGFLRALPFEKLENTFIDIIFVADNSSQVSDHLLNMFFLDVYKKAGVSNGKLNYLKLEQGFLNALPKGKKIKDYIASSRRYSYAAFLSINARTFTSGGEK